MSAYDIDTYAWANEQADALRRRSANEIDWDNVAEEIESVGRSEKRELSSRLEVLVLHLLKWAWQPEGRGNSWRSTIMVQREAIEDHLSENPSLRPLVPEMIERLYNRCRLNASGETNLAVEAFPLQLPFSVGQTLDDNFWPEASEEFAG